MGGPADGRYLIESTSLPGPPIGVERGSRLVVPVVTGGSDNVFTITSRGDGYSVMLRNPGPRFTAIEGDELVAPIILPATNPDDIEYTPWNIRGPESGPYVISRHTDAIGAIQAWTVKRPGPDQPVALEFYTPDMDMPQWNLIRQDEAGA